MLITINVIFIVIDYVHIKSIKIWFFFLSSSLYILGVIYVMIYNIKRTRIFYFLML